MQLYTYWARTTLHCHAPDGRPYHLVAYTGSDESLAAAQAAGRQVVQARQARLLTEPFPDEYPRSRGPLREQVEQRILDGQGQLVGAVTRNRYGSLILNAPRVMFLDVDDEDLRQPLPTASEPFSWSRFFRQLFAPAPAPPPLVPHEPHEQIQLRLAAWLQLHPDWKFRLYRTRRGFRLLVMQQLLAPTSPEAQEVFAAMRTDTLYVQLCQTQDCYRARLTPKPWRMSWHRPPNPFPFDTPEQEQQQQAWEREYAQRSRDFSVCEWVGEYGRGLTCPEAGQLAELHDAACLGGRPLA